MPMIPPRPRPYFVPADLDYDSLPEAVRIAVDELVHSAYDELVLQTSSALERSAGATYVCLLFLELLDQFDLGSQVAHRLSQHAESAAPRDEALNRYMRLVGSKERAGLFLLRIRSLRSRDCAHPSSASE